MRVSEGQVNEVCLDALLVKDGCPSYLYCASGREAFGCDHFSSTTFWGVSGVMDDRSSRFPSRNEGILIHAIDNLNAGPQKKKNGSD